MNLRFTPSLGYAAHVGIAAALLLALCPQSGRTQSVVQYSEDFTGTTTNNPWFFYNGACLTAGTNTSTASPGYVPSCTSVLLSYYNVANATTGKAADPYLVGGDLGYLGGSTAPASPALQLPDAVFVSGNSRTGGALRFTNGYPYGYHENGAIVSDFTFPTSQGIEITFKTVTYLGNSGGSRVNGNGDDGADGLSFYLIDGCMPLQGATVPTGCPQSAIYGTSGNTFPGIGAWGGSLAYTCSNVNTPYDGLVGAYLGLGIDEYGNFLNGSSNTLSESGTSASGDNTATGGGYQPERIGLRGAGSVAWLALTTAYGANTGSSSPYYPASLATTCSGGGIYNSANGTCSTGTLMSWLAVQKTCSTGNLYNYSTPSSPTSVGAASLTNSANTAGILDYPALYYNVLSGVTMANESAQKRGSTTVANTTTADATPITYQLKLTPDAKLSLSYSFNGGAYQPVVTGQSILSANGPLPSSFRFAFGGSTGGSDNIHEVMCFKAEPTQVSQSSAGINVYENPTIKFGTQLFLAYYFPSDWSGQLTAQTIGYSTTLNSVVVASVPNWDARCVLTGVNATTGPCSTGATSMPAEAPTSRVMLTWNGSAGIPFEWSNLTTAEQTMLDQGDSTQTSDRLSYLRGDRTNEISSTGTCPQNPPLACYRQRDSVLADIVDSSPTWVGSPQTYVTAPSWTDSLYPSATAPEASGQTYAAYQQAEQGRLNVVYVGANDGFLHGFRAGSQDANGNLINNSSTPNDGEEVLAYMPGAVLQTIHNATNASLDYPNTQYAHAWFVDATPGTGDLYYAGTWHTWLVGGIGPGGAALYALDVTNPSNFSETDAASLVIGEWTPSNLSCANVASCGNHLGNTYGTPQIRRFHNGSWGVIFGNGYASADGTAGIFIMLLNPSSGSPTFYYLPTTSSASGNGIASVGTADLDGDHIVDYIYAGDLKGNVWRFDVTSQNPSNWAVSTNSPLFTTPSGQPITTAVTVSTLKPIPLESVSGEILPALQPERVIINFGTGQYIPQTVAQAAQYASGTQYVFGLWDWNMSAWNTLSAGQQAIALTGSQTISLSTLVQQTITTVSQASPYSSYRTVTSNFVCWVTPSPFDTSSMCPNPGTDFGWYMQLPATGEQIIFDPVISPDGELVFNSFIPVQDSPLVCDAAVSGTGFSMAVQPDSGSSVATGPEAGSGSTTATAYFNVNTSNGAVNVSGVQQNAVGLPMFISVGMTGNNTEYMLGSTAAGGATTPQAINRYAAVQGARLYWIQRR